MKRARPLADVVAPVLGPALAAQGFTGNDLSAAWAEIAGERLALRSRPIRVEWPRRRPGADPAARSEPATLVLRIESAFALEAQHMAPLLIERVNAIYGWRCIGRIVLKQGRVAVPPAPLPPPRAPTAAETARIGAATGGIPDEALACALDRLGREILVREPDRCVEPPGPPALPGRRAGSSATAIDDGASS